MASIGTPYQSPSVHEPIPACVTNCVGHPEHRRLRHGLSHLHPARHVAQLVGCHPARRNDEAPTGAIERPNHIAVQVDSVGVGSAERHQGERTVPGGWRPIVGVLSPRIDARSDEAVADSVDTIGVGLHDTGNQHEAAAGHARYVVEGQRGAGGGQPRVEVTQILLAGGLP